MRTQMPVREEHARLAAGESDIAGRAVFAWVLVPAAGRMVHELAEGHDAHDAVDELRAAVRLLDRLGWPDDESGETRLTPDEAAVVRVAARSQLGRVVDSPRTGALAGVLDALERGRR